MSAAPLSAGSPLPMSDPLPVGAPLPDWKPARLPSRATLVGRTCRLEFLVPERDAAGLFPVIGGPSPSRLWTYLPAESPPNQAELRALLNQRTAEPNSQPYVIGALDSGPPLGMTSFLRIDRPNGVIEVGWVLFGPALQRTTAATEAIYLQLREAFDLGYRRVEWKCDSCHAASRSAARRFGFAFEGIFRQAVVTKGRNRDTAWFSLLDGEWPRVRAAFEAWLDPANFDEAGGQRRTLGEIQGESSKLQIPSSK